MKNHELKRTFDRVKEHFSSSIQATGFKFYFHDYLSSVHDYCEDNSRIHQLIRSSHR